MPGGARSSRGSWAQLVGTGEGVDESGGGPVGTFVVERDVASGKLLSPIRWDLLAV